MLPIAHAGHWILWFLYAVPLIVVVVSIGLSIVRNRDQPEPGDDRDEQDELSEQERGGPPDGSGPRA